MARIMAFCIPAWGHTNPTLEVVRELIRRGNEVRYYSFAPFQKAIEETGACFVPCDDALAAVDEKTEKRLRRASTTEMTLQAIETTQKLDARLAEDVKTWKPDVIFSDAVCFWGKLTAQKHGIPLICSTTTFAFNQYSAKTMRYSFGEMADIILGMGKVKRALRTLEPLGYTVKNAIALVQNSNDTRTVVYTSKRFQPFAETFDEAFYRFVGPSVKETAICRQKGQTPLVYISLGTVINDRADFYQHCIQGLAEEPVRVLISCGEAFQPASLGALPENVTVLQRVNQLEVLAEANLFMTHCGMNSASEGLLMGVPEILFPQTGEERAVANRVTEMGAGIMLREEDAKSADGLRRVVMAALQDDGLLQGAEAMRENFLSCGGAKEAADFIESVI